MCKYCKPLFDHPGDCNPIEYKDVKTHKGVIVLSQYIAMAKNPGEKLAHMFIESGFGNYDDILISKDLRISYCPFCGEKLKDGK